MRILLYGALTRRWTPIRAQKRNNKQPAYRRAPSPPPAVPAGHDVEAHLPWLLALPLAGGPGASIQQAEQWLRTTRLRLFRQGLVPNPVGVADAKTGAPGTYRPVGPTCPASCPQMAACYARTGNVGTHERRAAATADPSLLAAALALVLAHKWGRAARLHVSGDFVRPDGRVDVDYVAGLISLQRALRARGVDVQAWSYTHVPGMAGYLPALAEAGIHVRQSDVLARNGAIVAPFDGLPALRMSSGLPIAACPAQASHGRVTCQDCQLCWSRPATVIAFAPHGTQAKKAEVTL